MAEAIRPHQIEAETQAAENDDSSIKSYQEATEAGYDAKKQDDGKATAPVRDAMYRDLTGVGESGTQGGTTGRENQNPIGSEKTDAPQPS